MSRFTGALIVSAVVCSIPAGLSFGSPRTLREAGPSSIPIAPTAFFAADQETTAFPPSVRVRPTDRGLLEFKLGFTSAFPQGEFNDQIDAGFGFGGFFGYHFTQAPLFVGLDFNYVVYGSETRREPFSTTIPDVTVEVSTSNNIVLGHALLRLQGRGGTLRPYAEGLFGMSYLYTTTSINNESGGEAVASSTNQHDMVVSGGGGAGAMLRVYAREVPLSGRINEVLIDLGARYLLGGEAEYLKEGSIRRVNGQVLYDTIRSRTDLLTVRLGVVLQI